MHLIGKLGLAIFKIAVFIILLQILLADLIFVYVGSYDSQRFAFVVLSGLLAVVCAMSYIMMPMFRSGFSGKALLPTLLVCLLFLVLSLPYFGQQYIWAEPGMYVAFFLLPYCLSRLLVSTSWSINYQHFFVLMVAGFCTFYGLASINVYLFALFDGVIDFSGFIPWGFVNIRYWSHIATWLLPLIPLAVFVGPWCNNRLWQVLVALGAGLWWWIVLSSAARGSAIGIALGVVLVSMLLGRRVYPWLTIFLLYFGVGVILWLLLSVAIPSLIADDVELKSLKTSSSGRWPLWVEAWHMSLRNFPFGMGPQSWLTHEPITEAFSESKKFGHPHNMYLMWAAEYGWLLIVALGGVVIQAVRNFWRRRAELFRTEDSQQILMLAGFAASASAALFHAGVSSVLLAPASMLVGMFVLIGFWGLVQPELVDIDIKSLSPPMPKTRIIFAAVFSTGLAIFCASWANEVLHYYKDMRIDESYYRKNVIEGTLPRFWRHGNFPREVKAE